jgi:hypothetical protein
LIFITNCFNNIAGDQFAECAGVNRNIVERPRRRLFVDLKDGPEIVFNGGAVREKLVRHVPDVAHQLECNHSAA